MRGRSIPGTSFVEPLTPRTVAPDTASGTWRSESVSGDKAGIVICMSIDVTDATFETEIIERSQKTPVVVDLWAPWCGPCKTLGPILEKVIDATGGKVMLAKVNVDENPGLAQAFRVQGIPAVFAIRDGQVVDAFQGALPEHEVARFVESLLPTADDELLSSLVAAGDEVSLDKALEIDPGNEGAIVALADIYTGRGEGERALSLLARVPETDDVRRASAAARLSMRPADDFDEQLNELLEHVKVDDEARQRFVDILELMGPDDPRTAAWRKKLTARLY
jgi:putative thioredoxin